MYKELVKKLNLEKGVEEELLKAIDEELKSSVPYHRFKEINDEKNEYKKQLEDRDKQLETLRKENKDNGELLTKIKELQEENKKVQEDYERQVLEIKKDNAIDNLLTKSNSLNNKAVRALLNLDNVTYENGELKGLDEQLKNLQEAEDSKMLFKTVESNNVELKGITPVNGNNGDKRTVNNTGAMLYSEMLENL